VVFPFVGVMRHWRFTGFLLTLSGRSPGCVCPQDKRSRLTLGDQQLRQPGLADSRGAEHQQMPDALAQIHPHRLLLGLDRVQGRLAAERWQRAQRVPPGAAAQRRGEPLEEWSRLPGDLFPPRPVVEPAGLDVALHLRPEGIAQALGVLLGPAKALSQKQPVSTHGDLVGTQAVGRQAAQVALVAQHQPGLAAAQDTERREHDRCGVGHTRWHHQRPGCEHCNGRGGKGNQRGPELDRGA